MPSLDDEFPSFGDAEVEDRGWHHEKAAVGIDDIPHGAALDFHLSPRRDGRIG
jgi:hypothetical protein